MMKHKKSLCRLALVCLALLIATSTLADCPAWLNQDYQLLRQDKTLNLCKQAKGKVLLLVNTASQCGFTPQFKSLEALQQKYQSQGLVVVGFPSDSFFQEHNDSEKTAEICYVNYGVTFAMLETSPVRGAKANPTFSHLGDALGSPSWNFNKYLIGKNYQPIQRFGSRVKPLDKKLTEAIENALAQ